MMSKENQRMAKFQLCQKSRLSCPIYGMNPLGPESHSVKRKRRVRALALMITVTTLILSGFVISDSHWDSCSWRLHFGKVPSELPYYGRSPPVYPSPSGKGSTNSGWSHGYAIARDLVSQMTLAEKVNLTYGYPGRCAGNSGTVPRLGLGSLCFADGPTGVRMQGEFVSAFPAGIHLGATFDAELMHRYGVALGREFAAANVQVALGPLAGPLGRLARGGRNWEGLSNDPYLSGVGVGAIIKGIQAAGVVAVPKHFLFNEQEFRRRDAERQPADVGIRGEAISTTVDDRTLHELYSFPFMDTAVVGTGGLMCSYQRANHSYGCQNSKLLNGILKTELGFEGFVLSDWDAQHSGVASSLAGLDIAMPHSNGYWADGLLYNAVLNGSVPVERLDDMVTRLLAAWYSVSHSQNATMALMGDTTSSPSTIPDYLGNHAQLIREIGAAGTVLVKNENQTLPLRNPRYLCLYGYDAALKSTPWDNPDRFGGGYEVNYGWNTMNGTLITGGGSGGATPPYVVSPLQALQERVVGHTGGVLRWDFVAEKPVVEPYASHADACLVFINAYSAESFDRPSLTDEASDRLVRHVADACNNTIVVLHNAGIRIVDDWIDHPNVTAVVMAGLPGQESGHSLVDVLYGDVNPSGRLPFTVARREQDYGSLQNASYDTSYFPEDDFSEGLFIDYRAFDRQKLVPRFEFGYGLSYTSFVYGPSELGSKWLVVNEDQEELDDSIAEFPDPTVAVVQGGHPDLWKAVAEVRCTVTNRGSVSGTEVVQLYVGVPGADSDSDTESDSDSYSDTAHGDTPVRQLRGFSRVGPLAPEETADVVFSLTRRDLSVWDVAAQQWRLRRGTYRLYAGASSRDLRVNGTLSI